MGKDLGVTSFNFASTTITGFPKANFKIADGIEDVVVDVKGATVTTPTELPKRVGYKFAGWYLDEGLTRKVNFPYEVEGEVTLYAKWIINTYTATFDVDGGSEIDGQTINHGGVIVEPTDPTKAGYIFDGWYAEVNGETEYDFDTPVTSNVTLYARWKPAPAKEDGCGSSIGGNAFAVGGVMLAAAALVAMKGFKGKKKED